MADNLTSLKAGSTYSSSETDRSTGEEHSEAKRKRSPSSSEELSSNDEFISLPGRTIIVPNAWYSFLKSVKYKLKNVPKYLKVVRRRAENLSPLPDTTSDWNETHSDIISIHQKFLVNLEPSDFISYSYINGIIMPTHKAIEYVNWKSKDLLVQEITRCMSTALESINLHFEAIQDIPMKVPHEMKNDFRAWRKGFLNTLKLQKLEMDKVNVVKNYCRHVEQYGRKFADQLKYMMINKRDEIETSQFLQLFHFFLMMFNFNVSCLPNIDGQTLEIGDTKISSIPDFLVTEEKESLEVLIVGNFKQRYGLNDRSSFVRSRCCQSHDSPIRHVSEDLIGQHGGELLSHIHLSVFGEKGIFGMIVQGTQVSLTSLFPESGYMESLKKREEENKEAILNISKGYNILTRAGRESLLEALLDLYFLQAYTYSLRGLQQEKTAMK